jgi:hypothetical protein
MKRFKAYFFEPTVAGGPTLLPDPADPNNGKWFFTPGMRKRENISGLKR